MCSRACHECTPYVVLSFFRSLRSGRAVVSRTLKRIGRDTEIRHAVLYLYFTAFDAREETRVAFEARENRAKQRVVGDGGTFYSCVAVTCSYM